MKFGLLLLIVCFISKIDLIAQKSIDYDIKSTFVGSTDNATAFWAVSNKYGTISSNPNCGLVQTKLFAGFDTLPSKKWDYSVGMDVLNRFDGQYKFSFHQYFLRLKYRFLIAQAGRMEEHIGNQDSTLSSGGLLWSRNAAPMPKVTIGILNYTPIPFTQGFLEIKGAISHGWFEKNTYVKHEWLHHKYIYVQAGGKLPVKIHAGFHHFVQWGGVLPDGTKLPSSLSDFATIFFAKQYDSTYIPFGTPLEPEYSNRVGNHLGSRHFGLDVNTRPMSVSLYYQTIFEDASGMKWHNVADGLWGMAVKLKKCSYLSSFVYEYLNTNDQSMSYTPDKNDNEPDDYFNNSIYYNGWTYKDFTIGSPLITSPALLKKIGIGNNTWYDYLRNNRVKAHHFGLKGIIRNIDYLLFVTYTENKGTYHYPFDFNKKSVSTYLELKKIFPKFYHIEVTLAVAQDFGKMYTPKSTFLFTLRQNGKLF
jgi:hypothetical protein